MLKVNIPVRLKNWVFWVGLGATVLAAVDVSPEMFTSWQLVWNELVALVNNPFRLGCAVIAAIGVFTDTTTAGLGDSVRALTYTKPIKE